MKYALLIAALPFGLLTAGCVAEPEGFACTAIYVTVGVTVLTESGAPADSVEITVTNRRTGTRYEIGDDFSGRGYYTIFTDRYYNQISSKGEPIRVTGRKGTLGFVADYQIAGGDCHIAKLAGPDTVVIR